METVGHNIANADTPGYSRQEAVHVASSPYTAPSLNSAATPGQLGSGVDISMIRRVRNEYLDGQARDCASGEGYWQSRLEVADQVEMIFPEPGGAGLQDAINNFFNDWHELNNSPQDSGIKAAIRESGYALANLFRQISGPLAIVHDSVAVVDDSNNITGGQVKDQVDRANEILAEIKKLNSDIANITGAGLQPNDLLDKRDLLIDNLAGYAPVEFTSQANGIAGIKIFGIEVIDGNNNQHNISAIKNGENMEISANGSSIALADYAGGSLAGLESARKSVEGHIADLNNLARAMADKVNYEHTHDDDGNVINNLSLFTYDPKNPAGSIQLQTDIAADPDKIDENRALKVARLRDTPVSDNGFENKTFEAKYAEIIAVVGVNTRTSLEHLNIREAMKEQIDNLRESTAGVSLDEELTKLVQFQYGFQASARVVSVIDDMLDVLINRLF